MKLEDLAECDAEVIQPIKYEYKARDGQDGVSLWEVSAYLIIAVHAMLRFTVPS